MNPALLSLHLTGMVGAALYRRLIHGFGSAEAALRAPLPALERVEGVGPKTAKAIAEAGRSGAAEREMEAAARAGVRLVSIGDEDYPGPLRTLYDPPLVLAMRGTYRDPLAVAIVGSRNCTPYGKRQADRFAAEMASLGITIVSGLARGIDTAAHRGALRKGRTIAVLGSGLGHIYPPENLALAEAVAERGCLLSEFPLAASPEPGNFPRRNRIVSGLSLGVLVVEATEKSGALITADWALEQSREVFCVPGSVENPLSRGCHLLLKQGAKLVESAADVLEEIPVLAAHLPAKVEMTPLERAVWGKLADEYRDAETLAVRSGLPASAILAALDTLREKGVVSAEGSRFRRRPNNC